MQRVGVRTSTATIVAALFLMAASSVGVARYLAPALGDDLAPVGDAASVIQVLQGQRTILWTSLQGPVGSIVVRGWPEVGEDVELGGALVIQRPDDPYAGVIETGDKPMSVTFEPG
jgi:hypothetical protein